MGIALRVLMAEDSVDDAELVLRELRQAGYDPVSERVQTAEGMKAALEREAWDLVVSDYSMKRFNAPAALNLLRQCERDVPFIVVSGDIGEDIAVGMMKAGAHDYVVKHNRRRFVPAVRRQLREAEIRRQQRLTGQARQGLPMARDEFVEQLKQENEDLIALAQVTANAVTTPQHDDLLHLLLGRIADVMRADTATILLADGPDLRIRASIGTVDSSESTVVQHVGEGFCGSVASRGKPVYVEDAAVDPLVTDPLIRERGVRSMLGVPLKRDDTLIGVLHVDWLTVRPCSDREVRLLERTAEACAAAIQNARLHQEAKRIAGTLVERETRLRQLSSAIEQTADSVVITDRKGAIQYVNWAFERITGYGMAEVIGGQPSLLKSGRHSPEFYERLWRTIMAGEPFRAVFVNRHKDGGPIYQENTITPIKDDRGEITHFVSTAKDITEREQAKEERQRLGDVLEASLNEIYMFDAQTLRFEYINAGARRNLGYSSDDMRAMTPLDLKPELSVAAFAELIGPLRRHEKEKIVFQTLHRRADGSLYPVEVHLQLFERGGKPVFLAVINDITERKLAERWSDGERRVLELIAGGAPLVKVLDELTRECAELCAGAMCSVLLLDADGRHLRHGAAASLPADYVAAIDGIEIGSCVGSCGTAAHTGRTVIVSDIATDPLWADCKELALPHGLRACSSVPILGAMGEVLGTFAMYSREPRAPTARDLAVHERSASLASVAILRHRTVEALRAGEERFRELAENIDEIFWMTDQAKTQMIYVSPAYEKIWGRTCASLYASPADWLDAIHPEDRERISRAVVHPPDDSYDEEFRIVRPDGSIRWIHDRDFPVRNAAGEVYRLAGVAQDITEHRQVVEQMLRAQRLETIDNLAGGVAHDLNNALAPILMTTELLRQKFPDTAGKYLDLVESGIKRGADMVRQLLTFARGAEGERLVIQPGRLLEEMTTLIESTFPKNIRVRTNYMTDLRPILGDVTRLHQVLLNLCVNARDALANGGTLTLEAENMEIEAANTGTILEAKPGSYVVWRVTDTGTGIAPEILDHIFEPFFTTKGPDKGTGLGLSTVLGIVKGHGGFVQIDSVPGQGSTFAVYLPACGSGARDTPLPTKAETTFHGNGETVLVVDDEAALREIMRVVLTKLNFKVLTAADATAALIQVSENQAELRAVITDLHMPHMDGLSFARAVKGKLPRIGIIVISGRLDEREAKEFRELGVSALLDKPFTQQKLVEALKAVFQT